MGVKSGSASARLYDLGQALQLSGPWFPCLLSTSLTGQWEDEIPVIVKFPAFVCHTVVLTDHLLSLNGDVETYSQLAVVENNIRPLPYRGVQRKKSHNIPLFK